MGSFAGCRIPQGVRGLNCWKYIKKNCCMNCGAGMCFWGVWSEGDMFSYEQSQHEKENKKWLYKNGGIL